MSPGGIKQYILKSHEAVKLLVERGRPLMTSLLKMGGASDKRWLQEFKLHTENYDPIYIYENLYFKLFHRDSAEVKRLRISVGEGRN